jgi:hypothetical protein
MVRLGETFQALGVPRLKPDWQLLKLCRHRFPPLHATSQLILGPWTQIWPGSHCDYLAELAPFINPQKSGRRLPRATPHTLRTARRRFSHRTRNFLLTAITFPLPRDALSCCVRVSGSVARALLMACCTSTSDSNRRISSRWTARASGVTRLGKTISRVPRLSPDFDFTGLCRETSRLRARRSRWRHLSHTVLGVSHQVHKGERGASGVL